ncbi:MAG: HEAT repeat domain-containing protein [Anaerolinea sp.]|nr:HEAT repeat domain-containing protein [Anaerolinea sp.]
MLRRNENDWAHLLSQAEKTYVDAVHSGATLESESKLSAALEYENVLAQFKVGGASVLPTLHQSASTVNAYRRNVAVRILLELQDKEFLKRLSASILADSTPQLTEAVLKILWKAIPPSTEDFEHLLRTRRWERLPMLRALLGSSFTINKVLELVQNSGDNGALHDLIEFLPESSNNSAILLNFARASSEVIRLVQTKTRLVAAFKLGLQGVDEGIQFLEAVASSEDELAAARACDYLSLLALPRVIKPLKRLLKSPDPNVVAVSMQAVANIGVVDLVVDLIPIIQRDEHAAVTDARICDEAVYIIRSILGGELLQAEYAEEFEFESIPPILTTKFKIRVAKKAEVMLKSFDPTRRYWAGHPISLSMLVDSLLSPHSGENRRAAYNLQSITGENYRYELDSDLVDNVKAVLAWKSRAANPYPLKPTGWAFMGNPIIPFE